ncbi:MAG: hypothetical protein M3177_02305 [Pseudomonadota bacterium]|nr:hypothetical protein [Pseudomonadota bacterium]
MAGKIDDDIERMELGELEKHLLQMHRNYTKAFQRRRAEELGKTVSRIGFDFDGFEGDLAAIENKRLENAILAAVAVADDLLAAMCRRQSKDGGEVKALLGPLGPLGDFNKRLKVAALAGFIDTNDLAFFDGLRKLRNPIAHSSRPKPPNRDQIARLIDSAPEWLDALIAEGRVPAGVDRGSETTLKAAIFVHLAKLAWGTILTPLAKQAEVPLAILLEEKVRPEAFVRLSKLGVSRAVALLTASAPPREPSTA